MSEEWIECDWCGKEVRMTVGTLVYCYMDVARGWNIRCCSEQCREEHKSQPRYAITATGRAMLKDADGEEMALDPATARRGAVIKGGE